MKRLNVLAVLVALAVSANVKWSSAQTAQTATTRDSALLGLMPEGGAVAVIDFQRIVGSSLWATISTNEKLKGTIDKIQSEMVDLGVKLSDVHTVAVVFSMAGMDNTTIAMTGGFERSDLLARLRTNGKVKLTSEKYKNFDVYKATSLSATPPQEKSGDQPAPGVRATAERKDGTHFVFYDASTVVIGNLQAVRNSVDVKTGARPSFTRNGKLIEALAQNQGAAIRFALAITPAMTSGLQSSELPIPDFSSVSLVFGTIDIASGIDLNLTLRSDTAEHANSIAERLGGLLGMAKGFLGAMTDPKVASIAEALKTVNITSADVDVKITGSLPMDLLNSLLSSAAKKAQ